MLFSVIGILIGIIIFIGGMYYYIKEKSDIESRKIYGIASVIGIVICFVASIKMILLIM